MTRLDEAFTPRSIPFCLAAAFAAIISSISGIDQPLDLSLLPSHIREFSIQTTRWQVMSYVSLIAFFAGVCLWYLVSGRRNRQRARAGSAGEIFVIVLTLGVVFLGCSHPPGFLAGFSMGAVAFLAFLRFWPLPTTKRRILTWVPRLLTVGYVVLMVALLWFSAIFIWDLPHIVTVESHYAVTVLPGIDVLTEGAERSNYGALMAALVAVSLVVCDLIGLQSTSLIVAVAAYQVVVFGLIVFGFWLLNRNCWGILGVALMATAPTLSTLFNMAISFPNQSALRYLSLTVGILLLIAETRRKDPSAVRLAFYSGVSLAANIETGIAFSCGVYVYLLLSLFNRTPQFRIVCKTSAHYVLMTGAFFVLTNAFFSLVVFGGDWKLFSWMYAFASGYGGVAAMPSILAALMVFFGGWAVMRGVMVSARGELSSVGAYESAMGTLMLVWMVYYVHREEEWNLWFQSVLLLLMVAPRVDWEGIKTLRNERWPAVLYTFLGVSFVCGVAFSSSGVYLDKIRRQAGSIQARFEKPLGFASRYHFHDEFLAERLGARLMYLQKIEKKEDYLVLSHLPTQIRLLGFNERFPWYEPFAEVTQQDELEEVVSWIDRFGPENLLLEKLTTQEVGQIPYRVTHLRNIVGGIARYTFDREESGWLIYQRAE